VAELTTKLVAGVVPKLTADAPVKPPPLMTTEGPPETDPTAPLSVGDTLPVPAPVVLPGKETVNDPEPPVTIWYTPGVSPFEKPATETC